jgi:hypothetical protein
MKNININVAIEEIVAGLVSYEMARDLILKEKPEETLWFLTRLQCVIRQKLSSSPSPLLKTELEKIYHLIAIDLARLSAKLADQLGD